MATSPQAAISEENEPSSHAIDQSVSQLVKSQSSSSLVCRRKSKIPRFKSASNTRQTNPSVDVPKSLEAQQKSSGFISDARKIKRMVSGTAPIDAAVDCSSAPEWDANAEITETVEATCVPRPKDLTITRRVGVDGVVIAWAPLEHDCVAGFQVTVGGRVVQVVRSPQRTKALVTGLPLAGSFTIGLITVANDGRCSSPVLVTQDRSRVYKNRQSKEGRAIQSAKSPFLPVSPRYAVPTCL